MFNFDILAALATVDFSIVTDMAHHAANTASHAASVVGDIDGTVAHHAADAASAASDVVTDSLHRNDVYESVFLKAGRAARLGNNPDLLNVFWTGNDAVDNQIINILKTATESNIDEVKDRITDLMIPFKSLNFIVW